MMNSVETESVTAFAKDAEWTGVRDDDRPAWIAMRATLVTASDVAAIMGEDPYRTPLDVYIDKVLPRPDEELGIDDPRFWGRLLEQPILQAVARHYGWEYRQGGALLRSRRWPWLGCTLDAEIDRGSGWIPLEGKTTRLPRGWNERDSELPTRFLLQHQAQLGVTGAPQGLVFALLQGSKPVQIEQAPIDDLLEIIVEAADEFISRVQSLDPPPAGARDKDALARLHPSTDGSVVELPPAAAEWLAELQELSAKRLEIARNEDALKNRIKQLLGEATYGVLPCEVNGKTVIKCAWESKAAHMVCESISRPVRPLKALPKVIGPKRPLNISTRTLAELLEHSLEGAQAS